MLSSKGKEEKRSGRKAHYSRWVKKKGPLECSYSLPLKRKSSILNARMRGRNPAAGVPCRSYHQSEKKREGCTLPRKEKQGDLGNPRESTDPIGERRERPNAI